MEARCVELEKIAQRLQRLYGAQAESYLEKIASLIDGQSPIPHGRDSAWDQRDVVLITYGDQIQNGGATPLQLLSDFLLKQRLDELIRIVHILPFFPSTSDDGFAVSDYQKIDPELGGWDDITKLAKRFDLMMDLVINHTSSQHRWFQDGLAGKEPYDQYYLRADPNQDLSNVARPRSLPLLTQFDTSAGPAHFWTTFSADQIDLNFENPDVLLEMLEVLLLYIQQGARVIRLDAIAYLWKEIGTSCIHLEQTHEVVKLIRDFIQWVAPHVLLLTETNVPHLENISYFGEQDEAHLIYQFSFPPLMLEAMISEDAVPLMTWLDALPPPPDGCNYFNFTASHDGIGVRPLEGLLSAERFSQFVDAVRQRGGLISYRRQADGSETPYELNISYVSACGPPLVADNGQAETAPIDATLHVRRFLTTQGLMLALRGIPAIYFHSLVGTENDLQGAEQSGMPRRINRRKLNINELEDALRNTESLQARIFNGYCKMLSIRIRQPAFHPDADQEVLPSEHPWLISFLRACHQSGQKILVLANVSTETQIVSIDKLTRYAYRHDLLSESPLENDSSIELLPGSIVWLEAKL